LNAFDEMVLVGRIARPHGLKGQVVVNPETDFVEERFAPGQALWVRIAGRDEQLTVATSRVHGRRPIVGFENVARIEDAERLSGLELLVPEQALRALAPGSFYEHDLAGCHVETVGGEPLGVVRRVDGSGAKRLVIEGARGELEIPLAQDICREIDV